MRYLILSDIHSNEEALSAVLARAQRRKYDSVVILGDFVGYGADPNAVIDRVTRIRKRKSMIRGNHDKVVCGLDSGDLFNPVALKAARWTTEMISSSSRRFLEGLPIGPLEVDRAFVEKTSAAIIVLLLFMLLMNGLAIYLRNRFERRW